MKFGIFDNFGAKNSAPVFAALRQGLVALGFEHASHDTQADVAVIWSVLWAGRMRQNRDVWQQFRSTGRPVLVLEVGMLNRGHTWKLSVNGTGSYAYHGQGIDLNRATRLGLGLLPWREHGSKIIVCAQRSESLQWQDQLPVERWLEDTRDRVRLYTQRPLVLRTHPRQRIAPVSGYEIERPIAVAGTYDDFDFYKTLTDAWAVINHNSGPGIQAVMAGVPAFVDASSLAAPVANLNLSAIENPVRPDRGRWLIDLAHTEWTVQEIASGWPIERLLPRLQSR